jgi:hypothetical protein
MSRSGTRRLHTVLALGTALSLLASPVAAQERAPRLPADNLSVVQMPGPGTGPTRSVREQIERVRAASDKLDEELTQLARLRRDLAERLPPATPGNQIFENTVQ